MDETPEILPLHPPAWDPESAARRIKQLETALLRRNEVLDQKQAALDDILNSGVWKAARLFCKVREKLLPLHSRRRRTVRTLTRAAGRLFHRLTGKDLSNPDADAGGNRLALDGIQYRHWMARHEPKPADLARQRKT